MTSRNSARKLDPLSAGELARERERHAAALAALSAEDSEGAVAEVNRHLDRVSDIMLALVTRRSGSEGSRPGR